MQDSILRFLSKKHPEAGDELLPVELRPTGYSIITGRNVALAIKFRASHILGMCWIIAPYLQLKNMHILRTIASFFKFIYLLTLIIRSSS